MTIDDLFLICFLFGLRSTNRRKILPSDTENPIPMWSISGPNFQISARRRKRIMQRGALAVFLAYSLQINPQRRACGSFCRLFRRLFTGPGSDTVAHLVFRPTIYQRLFNSKCQILPGLPDCIYMQTHPVLPLVALVEYDSQTEKSSIRINVLSADRKKVVNQIKFQQDSFQSKLTWHHYLPILATSSGQIPTILELEWYDGKFSTSVTLYHVTLDERPPTRFAVLNGHQCPVTAVAFCPNDPSRVATGDNGGSIRLWDTSKSICLYKIDPDYIPPHNIISFVLVSSIIWMSPTSFVTGNRRREMNFVQISAEGEFERRSFSANPTKEFPFSCGYLSCMAPHPSGRFFATIVNYFNLILWDASSLEILSTLEIPHEAYSFAFNPLGNLLFIGSVKNLMIVGVSPDGNQMRVLAQNDVHKRYITNVVVHTVGDDNCILSGAISGSLVLLKFA
jgi:WD40 repeat protein